MYLRTRTRVVGFKATSELGARKAHHNNGTVLVKKLAWLCEAAPKANQGVHKVLVVNIPLVTVASGECSVVHTFITMIPTDGATRKEWT